MSSVRALLRLAVGLVAAVSLAASPASVASEATLQDVKTLMEGVYTLKEWHTAQTVLQPPAIDGRFVLSEGVVVTVLKNWSQAASKVSGASYGSYVLDSSGFRYKYEEGTAVTETPTGSNVSHKLIFDGTRSFTVSREADGVHFRRAEGGIEFAFTKDGLTYSENGKVLRVWQRVKAARPA